MNRNAISASCVVASLICGCTSFSSTVLNRLDDNSFVGNSNGRPKPNQSARPYNGVPVALQVPSHLDVYIDETYYLQKADQQTGDVPALEQASIPPLRSVRAVVIKSKKVFFVDFKRPGSGVLDLNLEFSQDQYFSGITSQLTDTTIQDVGDLAGTIKSIALKGATAFTTSGTLDTNKFMKQTRVVAYRRFDINDPDYEALVDEFVRMNLTDCDQSCRVTE